MVLSTCLLHFVASEMEFVIINHSSLTLLLPHTGTIHFKVPSYRLVEPSYLSLPELALSARIDAFVIELALDSLSQDSMIALCKK